MAIWGSIIYAINDSPFEVSLEDVTYEQMMEFDLTYAEQIMFFF